MGLLYTSLYNMAYSKKWRVFVELRTLGYEVVVDYC